MERGGGMGVENYDFFNPADKKNYSIAKKFSSLIEDAIYGVIASFENTR